MTRVSKNWVEQVKVCGLVPQRCFWWFSFILQQIWWPLWGNCSGKQWIGKFIWTKMWILQGERERGRVLVSFIHDRHRIFFQLFYSMTFKLMFQNSFYNLIDCRVAMHSYYFCLNFHVDAFTFKFTSLSLQYLQQT